MEKAAKGYGSEKRVRNYWYSVFYTHQYKQSCRQNSGEGSKHVAAGAN